MAVQATLPDSATPVAGAWGATPVAGVWSQWMSADSHMSLPCQWPVGEANMETNNWKESVIETWCVCGTEPNLNRI